MNKVTTSKIHVSTTSSKQKESSSTSMETTTTSILTTTDIPTTAEPTCKEMPLDLVLLVDISKSPEDFESQRQFLKDTIKYLDISDESTRVGIVSYGGDEDVPMTEFLSDKNGF